MLVFMYAYYHTLIFSGDYHLLKFWFLLAELSSLTPIVTQSVRFFGVSEGNEQNTKKDGKGHFWGIFQPLGPLESLGLK